MKSTKLSNNFHSAEFSCKCGCGYSDISIELINVLESLRCYLSKPIIILSGCRCYHHNLAVGGRVNSYHQLGMAADIKICGFTKEEVINYLDLKYYNLLGVGIYPGFIHIDVRGYRARW